MADKLENLQERATKIIEHRPYCAKTRRVFMIQNQKKFKVELSMFKCLQSTAILPKIHPTGKARAKKSGWILHIKSDMLSQLCKIYAEKGEETDSKILIVCPTMTMEDLQWGWEKTGKNKIMIIKYMAKLYEYQFCQMYVMRKKA